MYGHKKDGGINEEDMRQSRIKYEEHKLCRVEAGHAVPLGEGV